ncbi:MAG TPA: GNAT family N-acetyltransferase [Mycobacteriales bacterium]
MIRPLLPGDAPAAAAIYNHYVAETTATFQTEPLDAAGWLAEATAGEPGRHGAWALTAAAAPGDAAAGSASDDAAGHAAPGDAAPGEAGGGAEAGPAPDGDLLGYLLVAPFKGRCAYRDTAEVTVYLDAAACGRGLGRAALAFAEEHARAAGLHALLAVVCAENEPSLRAFARAGYEEVGRLREVGRKFGRLLDVVYLEKVVGSAP